MKNSCLSNGAVNWIAAYVMSGGENSRRLMRSAMALRILSARAFHRVLKFARTIDDLGGEDQIRSPHLAKALQYRTGQE